MRAASLALLAAVVVTCPLAACSSEPSAEAEAPSPGGTKAPPGGPGTPGDGDPDDPSGPSPCPRTPKAADRARKVIVSHPYTAASERANTYEVLDLSATGELSKTGQTFEMGRGFEAIAFTPDGEIGITAQEDGTLGVLRVSDVGDVSVVHAAFSGSFHASGVVMSRDGARAFVLDSNTKDNGGGVYQVAIGCDGKLTDEGMLIPGGRAHAMALVPTKPDEAILIAGAALDSPAGDYAHHLDLARSAPKRIAGGPVFDDEAAIVSSVGVTFDGKWALVADHGLSAGNRMAPVEVATMKKGAPIAVSNPVNVIMSPFGNAGLLIESDGSDHLRRFTYDPANAAAPFKVANEVAYVGKKTSLPLAAATITVGSLEGRVFVAELDGVRQLAFGADGSLTDLGKLSFGDGIVDIVGALGVQP